MRRSAARPEARQRFVDISIHCSDSRMRGPSYYAAREATGFHPYAVTSPGTTATPKIIRHFANVINEEYAKHPKTVFRIHVVGHGTIEPVDEMVEGGGYINFRKAGIPPTPSAGWATAATSCRSFLAASSRTARSGSTANIKR